MNVLNLWGAWMGGRDGRLDVISSHCPSVGSYHCDGISGWRSRTRPRPWTRTPSMWCRALRIGYHDQNVRTSTAAPPPTVPPLSPSRTATKLICASALHEHSFDVHDTWSTRAWMPLSELTNGAMHAFTIRPSTFPHNYYHPTSESCHCQCRMITSTRADECAQSVGGMDGRS